MPPLCDSFAWNFLLCTACVSFTPKKNRALPTIHLGPAGRTGPSTRKTLFLASKKKRTMLPELGGGRGGNLDNAQKKTFFFWKVFPNSNLLRCVHQWFVKISTCFPIPQERDCAVVVLSLQTWLCGCLQTD